MESKTLNAEQLNNIPHDVMVQMYLQQAEAYKTLMDQNSQLLSQNAELIKKVGALEENIAVLNYRLFGRKTERVKDMPGSDQMKFNFDLDDPLAFNEAEVLVEDGMPEEPNIETVIIHRKKTKGKRKEDLSHVDEVTEDMHELSEEELAELFPNGYDRLPDEHETGLLRRHHRSDLAVPAGTDGIHSTLYRGQDESRQRKLQDGEAAADPGRDLRLYGVPGAGDADRARPGRIQLRPERPGAPRHGEEEAQGHGGGTPDLRARAGERAGWSHRTRLRAQRRTGEGRKRDL